LSLWFPPTLKKYQSDGATLDGKFIYHDSELDITTESQWVQCLMEYYGVLPENFELTSDADSPDNDGKFNLSWTDSAKADKYSVYYYHRNIEELNESLTLIQSDLTSNSYTVENMQNGIYYYLVVAYNEYGYAISNCECVFIEIPPDENNNSNEISPNAFIIAFIIIGILSIVAISAGLYKKKRKI